MSGDRLIATGSSAPGANSAVSEPAVPDVSRISDDPHSGANLRIECVAHTGVGTTETAADPYVSATGIAGYIHHRRSEDSDALAQHVDRAAGTRIGPCTQHCAGGDLGERFTLEAHSTTAS